MRDNETQWRYTYMISEISSLNWKSNLEVRGECRRVFCTSWYNHMRSYYLILYETSYNNSHQISQTTIWCMIFRMFSYEHIRKWCEVLYGLIRIWICFTLWLLDLGSEAPCLQTGENDWRIGITKLNRKIMEFRSIVGCEMKIINELANK